MLNINNPSYFVTSDKNQIFYNTNFNPSDLSTSMPVLLFNYGLVCNNAHWEYQIKFFDNLNYPIILHNYRGHFNSSPIQDTSDYSISKITYDTKELLEYLDVKNVVALGHSMGVNICLELATQTNLAGMVLISGTVLPPQEIMFDSNIIELIAPYVEMISKLFPELYEKFWKTSYLNPLAAELMLRGGFNTKKVPKEFVQTYMRRIGQLNPEVFFRLLNDMQNHSVIGQLEHIDCPALIMGGDKDNVIPNYLQRMLFKFLKNSELYIIKDGSHVPQVDFPDTINERIDLFLHTFSENLSL